MRFQAIAVLVALSGCAEPEGLEAKVWTVEDFLRLAPEGQDLGGFRADQLVVLEGQPIPFRSRPYAASDVLQGPGYGLTPFPAFADGQPASFTVTEIWFAHPTPWIQPGYVMASRLTPEPTPLGGLNIFPVGVEATFYSPFWQLFYALAPDAGQDEFRSATAVLGAHLPLQRASLVYCPLAPADGGVAAPAGVDAGPTHPWLLVDDVGGDGGWPQAARPMPMATSWVDGTRVPYFRGGVDRIEGVDQLPVEHPLYTFAVAASDGGRALLPIPAVLPEEPFRSSFVRRTDVLVGASSAVFVPPDRPELIALLRGMGVKVACPQLDESTARLRLGAVIDQASCVRGRPTVSGCVDNEPDGGGDDGGVLDPIGGCEFLDSAAAVRGVNSSRIIPTETTLAIGVTQVGRELGP
ncbi:MAG: hypothetical protein AB1938_07315 [Myxococcota bacterium]